MTSEILKTSIQLVFIFDTFMHFNPLSQNSENVLGHRVTFMQVMSFFYFLFLDKIHKSTVYDYRLKQLSAVA